MLLPETSPIRDSGWWAEAYVPEVGWALGDGREHDDDPRWDAVEAEQLYALLEGEIVPSFYNRDDAGIPQAWVDKVRQSMARVTPLFSANPWTTRRIGYARRTLTIAFFADTIRSANTTVTARRRAVQRSLSVTHRARRRVATRAARLAAARLQNEAGDGKDRSAPVAGCG